MLFPILQRAFALLSLAALAVGGYFAWSWWRLHEVLQPQPGELVDTQDWRLWLGGGLLAVSLLGRLPLGLLLGRAGDDGERLRRPPGAPLETADGAVLHVERQGPDNAPVLVFVHGWGLDAGMWWEARRTLSERYQVVTFDLAGLGKSRQPRDGHYSLERFADHLRAVVEQAGRREVILVGHSIGGMTVQTYCRRHADTLGAQVVGVVLENTTPVDPTLTTVLGEPLHALEPVLRPLMRLDVWLQPLVWLMNWQSYLSGATHVAMRLGGFGGRPTRAQLNQVALAATRNSPAVQAKGNIAMMDWDGAGDLMGVDVPALVFIGGRDIVTVPEAGEAIVWGLRRARAYHADDAGHLGPMEWAAEYNGAIAEFADQVFSRDAQAADGPVSAPPPTAEPARRADAGAPPPPDVSPNVTF